MEKCFYLNEAKLRFDTEYHPQSNVQAEALKNIGNSTFEPLFMKNHQLGANNFIGQNFTITHQFVVLQVFHLFQIVYDRPPPSVQSYISGFSELEVVESSLTCYEVLSLVKQNLFKAQKQ